MLALGSVTMTLKAQVRGGRLVLNEPTDLPEGAEVELMPVLDDDLGPEERQTPEASLARPRSLRATTSWTPTRYCAGSVAASGEGSGRTVHSRLAWAGGRT